jgi:EAL domain-containing protein (putative c-di-GMP-specific phosphodiesterase class I)
MLDVVKSLGADYAQGYALGRPFVLAPQFPRIAGNESTADVLDNKAG